MKDDWATLVEVSWELLDDMNDTQVYEWVLKEAARTIPEGYRVYAVERGDPPMEYWSIEVTAGTDWLLEDGYAIGDVYEYKAPVAFRTLSRKPTEYVDGQRVSPLSDVSPTL